MRWIYERDDDNLNRYSLGQVIEENGRTLICFGINPSTACPDSLDNIINKIIRIACYNEIISAVVLIQQSLYTVSFCESHNLKFS